MIRIPRRFEQQQPDEIHVSFHAMLAPMMK